MYYSSVIKLQIHDINPYTYININNSYKSICILKTQTICLMLSYKYECVFPIDNSHFYVNINSI